MPTNSINSTKRFIIQHTHVNVLFLWKLKMHKKITHKFLLFERSIAMAIILENFRFFQVALKFLHTIGIKYSYIMWKIPIQ